MVVEAVIGLLQALTGLTWLAVLLQRIPGVVRLFRPDPSVNDVFGLPIALVAICQIGFSVRWWVWPRAVDVMEPSELIFWGGLYLASSLSAVALVALRHKFMRPK